MIDCRKVPNDINCSLTIAGTEDEVLDAAVAHAAAIPRFARAAARAV
jgi:hypothetical protein